MNTDRTIPTLVLLLQLSLGALLLSHAFLTLVALAMPAFAASLAAQGMSTPVAWSALLTELAVAMLLILGVRALGELQ